MKVPEWFCQIKSDPIEACRDLNTLSKVDELKLFSKQKKTKIPP